MTLTHHATYLDYNSGASLHPSVLDYLAHLNDEPLIPNASSSHTEGRALRKALHESTQRILTSVGISSEERLSRQLEVTYVSSGTDANQTVIRSVLRRDEKNHWITSPIEHPSVLAMVDEIRKRGGEVTLLSVNQLGEVNLEELENILKRKKTQLVSLMGANNELGITSHIQSIKKITSFHHIPYHSDCIALWGKEEIQLRSPQASPDFITLSPYKIGALAGVGIILHPAGFPIWNPFLGAQQEGRRGGAMNALGIICAGIAAETIPQQLIAFKRIGSLRSDFEGWLKTEIPRIQINAQNSPHRLTHVLSLTLPGFKANLNLANRLDLKGISVSSGSACSSGISQPSHVLTAIGLSPIDAMNSIRISMNTETSWEACLKLGEALKEIVLKENQGHAPSKYSSKNP